MTRTRGRPARGTGVTRDDILVAALDVLDEGGGKGLTMRALAARLGVTPMALYHHVQDHAGLLRALSDRVYAEVLAGISGSLDSRSEIREILLRYRGAVCRHPQLTLAISTTPQAFSAVTRQITDRLIALLTQVTTEPRLWLDILVDHAHGSGLPSSSTQDGCRQVHAGHEPYLQALDRLLDCLAG